MPLRAKLTFLRRRKMNNRSQSGKILWIGWGDLARKCKEAFSAIEQKGYDILALDVVEQPVGLQSTQPKELFLRPSRPHHEKLVAMAKRDGFDAIYVANYGHQHISTTTPLGLKKTQAASRWILPEPFILEGDTAWTPNRFGSWGRC
jgi:hypothetical protein